MCIHMSDLNQETSQSLTPQEVSTKHNPVICVPCGPGLDVKMQLKSFCSHMIIVVIKFVRELCC